MDEQRGNTKDRSPGRKQGTKSTERKGANTLGGVNVDSTAIDLLDKKSGISDTNPQEGDDARDTSTPSHDGSNNLGDSTDSKESGATREVAPKAEKIISDDIEKEIAEATTSNNVSTEPAKRHETVTIVSEPAKKGRKRMSPEEKARRAAARRAAKEKGKQADSVVPSAIPAKVVIPLADAAIVRGLSYSLKKIAKKEIDPRNLLLTSEEREGIEPLVDVILDKYLTGDNVTPEGMLISALAVIYGSKIVSQL